MSRFNTGNPLGSGDPRDLDDNAKNMDLAVNSDGETFQDRMGRSRLTWAGIVRSGTGDPSIAVDAAARAEAAASQVQQDAAQIAHDAAEQAVVDVVNAVDGAVGRAESAADAAQAAADAAFVNADVYPDVASGLAAVAEGEQFQVVSSDGLEIIRYRHDPGSVATEVSRLRQYDVSPNFLPDVYNEYSSSGLSSVMGAEVISWSSNLQFREVSSVWMSSSVAITPVNATTIIGKRIPLSALPAVPIGQRVTVGIRGSSPSVNARVAVVVRDADGSALVNESGAWQAPSASIETEVGFTMPAAAVSIEVRLVTASAVDDTALIAVAASVGGVAPAFVSAGLNPLPMLADIAGQSAENLAPDPLNYAAAQGVTDVDGYGIGTNAVVESFPASPFASKTAIRRRLNSDRELSPKRLGVVEGDAVTFTYGVVPAESGLLTMMAFVRYGDGSISAVTQKATTVVDGAYQEISVTFTVPSAISEPNARVVVRLQATNIAFPSGVPVVAWGAFKSMSSQPLVDQGLGYEDIRMDVAGLNDTTAMLQYQIDNLEDAGRFSRQLRERNLITVAGQSLSFATGGSRISTGLSPNGIFSPTPGVRSDLIPADPMTSTGLAEVDYSSAAGGEYPVYGCAEQLQAMLTASGYSWSRVVAATSGKGGATIDELMGVTTSDPAFLVVDRVIDQYTRYKGFAESDDLSFEMGDFVWMQGEADAAAGTSRSVYRQKLNDLRDMLRSQIGQPSGPDIMMYQTSSHTKYSAPPAVPLAQLDAAIGDDGIRMACPTYMMTYPDGLHMDSHSYRWMGCLIGKALYRLYETGDWKPLHPVRMTRTGRVCVIDCHVPAPPLVLDTDMVSDPGSYGFTAVDSEEGPLVIESVAILGDDKVKVVLQDTPHSEVSIRYAWGTAGADAGSTTGARGCLRDSDPTVAYADDASGNPYKLYNWCVISEIGES